MLPVCVSVLFQEIYCIQSLFLMCRFWPLLCPTVSKRRAIAQKLEKKISRLSICQNYLPTYTFNYYVLTIDRAAWNNGYLETFFFEAIFDIEAVIFVAFDISFHVLKSK